MYAVILEQKLLYLGHDQSKAVDVFRLKKNAELHCLQNTYDLKNLIKDKNEAEEGAKINQEDSQSPNKIDDLFKRLENIDDSIDSFQKCYGRDDRAIQVRYLGHKDMKPVGKGFICVNKSINNSEER